MQMMTANWADETNENRHSSIHDVRPRQVTAGDDVSVYRPPQSEHQDDIISLALVVLVDSPYRSRLPTPVPLRFR